MSLYQADSHLGPSTQSGRRRDWICIPPRIPLDSSRVYWNRHRDSQERVFRAIASFGVCPDCAAAPASIWESNGQLPCYIKMVPLSFLLHDLSRQTVWFGRRASSCPPEGHRPWDWQIYRAPGWRLPPVSLRHLSHCSRYFPWCKPESWVLLICLGDSKCAQKEATLPVYLFLFVLFLFFMKRDIFILELNFVYSMCSGFLSVSILRVSID